MKTTFGIIGVIFHSSLILAAPELIDYSNDIRADVYPAPTTRYSSSLKMETLGRGLVAVRCAESQAFVTWRSLPSDPTNMVFTIGGVTTSNYWAKVEYDATQGSTYSLKTNEVEIASVTLKAGENLGYLTIPLNSVPTATGYTYTPNDASVGDLDGDGEFEIVLKWDTDKAMDNGANSFTYTGNQIYQAMKLDGTVLWTIDAGHNIPCGDHYGPFIVWDLDEDGRAEFAIKTSHGTVDGTGTLVCGCESTAACLASHDYRESSTSNMKTYGRVMSGEEYLTVFDGRTGAALKTVDYVPGRGEDCFNSSSATYWGDNYANRSERYLAGVAYLDGLHPSLVMCRGYYNRTALTAWRFERDTSAALTLQWAFDTTNSLWTSYAGQGFHSLRVGDVDFDGKDEIVYGSMVVDHDGTGLANTGAGHGDALHLVQGDSATRGLQVATCHEDSPYGLMYREGASSSYIWRVSGTKDTGAVMAADVDPTMRGVEIWGTVAAGDYFKNIYGEDTLVITNSSKKYKASYNWALWWDGDLARETLDTNVVYKYSHEKDNRVALQTFTGAVTINKTKCNPALGGDIVGDWREELLFPSQDGSALRLYVSTNATDYAFHTFLADPVYRIGLALENVGYNQCPSPGFYFGPDLLNHDFKRYRGHPLK